ncbi:uncharacterized protein OCT59_010829 [Rhizophagus irregularis]|uniref:uncharacterized protein n=1 Tax=Rhizophagus irregularis TaxID=588596 RepID=UPI0033342F65|nr:hypothetical protein OCT59_010829 [Rhizophagus irregularis]
MLSTRIRLLKEVVGLRQTWILGMVSAFGSWALDIWVSAFGYWALNRFSWALDIWVSASGSWALDRFPTILLLQNWFQF